MLYVQMVGRGLRICEGKDHLLILDHSNNHSTHGFITDCHFDRLNKGEKEERGRSKPMPKPCTSCGALKPVGVLKCPNCGFEPKPKCDVVYRDGELIEYTARHKALPPEGAAFFAEVRAFGEAHGFKPGWAAHKYKERYGAWPPWSWNQQPTVPPSPATMRWIRSRQIAYAKSKKHAPPPPHHSEQPPTEDGPP